MSANATLTAVEVETIRTVQNILDILIIYGNNIFQILCVILFLYRIYKNDPIFRTIYYYILVFGYFMMAFTGLLFKIDDFLKRQLFAIYNIFQWYNFRFYAVQNTVLAFNRFTGMFFYLYHKRLWQGKFLFIILAFLFLYPIIITSHTLGDIDCLFLDASKNPRCHDFFHQNIVSVSNMVHGCLSLILGVLTALARKIRGQEWAKKQKYETFLLVQSIVSTILMLIGEIASIAAEKYYFDHIETYNKYFGNYLTLQMLINLSNWIGVFYHSSSAILIICLSKGVRQSFVSFYRLYYIPGIQNPTRENEVSTLHSLQRSSSSRS